MTENNLNDTVKWGPAERKIPFVTEHFGFSCRKELLCRAYSLKINPGKRKGTFEIPLYYTDFLYLDREEKCVYYINKRDGEKKISLFNDDELLHCSLLYSYEMRDIKEIWDIYFNFFGKDNFILLSLVVGSESWVDEDRRHYTDIFCDVLEKCKALADIFRVKLYDRFNEPGGKVRVRNY